MDSVSATREALVREAFLKQAGWCDKLGSPFTAALMRGLATGLDRTTATGTRCLDWAGQPDANGDSVPLRLAGGLNALVRAGNLPDLAAFYPPNAMPDEAALAAAALAAIRAADAELLPWLDSAPQTNEVARSSLIHAGLMVIADATGLPLALFEVGASAGLNLNNDRYAYRFGDREAGTVGAPVRLAPAWTGPVPPDARVSVAGREGCDLNPLDITEDAQVARLSAYIWPDQTERLARFEAAAGIARRDPPKLVRMDAADWVAARFGMPGEPGICRVLFHTIAFQYFPESSKDSIRRTMALAGSTATPANPVAWLGFENAGPQGAELSLTLWPTGETRVLARGDAHGRAVTWLG